MLGRQRWAHISLKRPAASDFNASAVSSASAPAGQRRPLRKTAKHRAGSSPPYEFPYFIWRNFAIGKPIGNGLKCAFPLFFWYLAEENSVWNLRSATTSIVATTK